MANKLTVVLTSGGLDSAVAAALIRQDSALALLHLQYGQQAEEAELRAFEVLCQYFKPAHHLAVSMGNWRGLSRSPLLRPHGDIEDAGALGPQTAGTFVPMLNASMLCAAAAWAHTLGAVHVVWGISLTNPGNYPDRADAVRLLAWQLATRSLPGGAAPSIEAPLAQYDKAAVVELARELAVPIDLTWSCLRPGPTPCQRCIGCTSRAKALQKAYPAQPAGKTRA